MAGVNHPLWLITLQRHSIPELAWHLDSSVLSSFHWSRMRTCLRVLAPGEGSRAWSAGAGCGALATGIVQVTWLLREIQRKTTSSVPAFLSWPAFIESTAGLYLWEAFVTGGAKRGSHLADAKAGVEAFIAGLPDPTLVNAVTCVSDVQSLVGAAMLRTGWTTSPRILQEPCLVVRAGKNEE